MAAMAEATGPRALFLGGLAAVYIAAFGSLYLQIPGLYGRRGLLPARRLLRLELGRGLWERLGRVPTLLWLSPQLGLDTEQGMELLCVLGVLGSLGALLCPSLRHCLVFVLLRMFYLSLYQVGQVFLYFQWDSLLLEAGFLAVLVAPLKLLPGGTPSWQPHDGVPLWGVRWLLFRLMFQSGVVKLSSRCPTWWGLTALSHHFESQCLPSPGAWLAQQLPLWLLKLGVVATLAIEVAVPPLFFAPLRRLRLFSFYCQVLLQTLIILTGNYNFFNALTIVLCFSLLDQQHLGGPAHRPPKTPGCPPRLGWLLELGTLGALLLGTARCFGLRVHGGVLDSNVAFTHHEFSSWLHTVTLPLVGVAFLSLSWEILVAFYRCALTRGCFWKLWAILQCAGMATATVGLFTISLVPFTSLDQQSQARLWPGVRGAFAALERFQLVNSYGLFRRITGTNGRPEVILQGSHDGHSWTEIEFMYKPGNVSVAPALVAPHQPRLDWQLWFAALGPHQSSPWFSALVLRLLQGQPDVIRLLQTDQSRYPFHARPPTFLRAQLYKYRFTALGQGGPAWWRRQHVQEFFPAVSLGHPTLEGLLSQHGLKDSPRPALCPLGVGSVAVPVVAAPPVPPPLGPGPALVPLPGGRHRGAAASPGPAGPGGGDPRPPQGEPGAGGSATARGATRGHGPRGHGPRGTRPEGTRPEARHGSRRKK